MLTCTETYVRGSDHEPLEIRRGDLNKLINRTTELEVAIREMHASIPGGSICDPQTIADGLRVIAERFGVNLK